MTELTLNNQIKINIMTKKEFIASKKEYPYSQIFVKSMEEAAYCKAEVFSECIFGILKVPDKKNLQGKFYIAGYYIIKGQVIFLDESGMIQPILDKLKEMETPIEAQEMQILLAVFNGIIEDEVPYLQKIEERITELEDILIEQPSRDFPQVLMRFRRAMTRLHGFYVQLLDMIEEIQGNAGEFMEEEDGIGWRMLSSRVSRLHGYTENIRENLLQLHELYQAQIDISQNEIMTILTIVTTIFLPLSLLAGWYGMNFSNIPLLNWKYGYLTVILITITIIAVEVHYFRKKGYLKKHKKM